MQCFATTSHFATFDIPEESSSDGQPQFESEAFRNFLRTWGIHFRLSSVGYAQSNGRAEVGVKTMKRLLHNNVSPDGSLNNNKVLRALLEYRNTPLPDIKLSPAQILFHRQLKDGIPTHRNQYHLHKKWIIAANKREKIFAQKNKVIQQQYNKHTRLLPELPVGTKVLIQGKNKKWTRQGEIIEALRYRQYRVKVYGSGRATLQNRRFIKPFYSKNISSESNAISPQASPKTLPPPILKTTIEISSTSNTGKQHPANTHNSSQDRQVSFQLPAPPDEGERNIETNRNTVQPPKRTPRELRNLETFNKPGLREDPVNPEGRR